MLPLLMLLACTPSDQDLAERVLSGELQAVAEAGVKPWSDQAQRVFGFTHGPERGACRPTEGLWYRQWAVERANTGDWDEALSMAIDELRLRRIAPQSGQLDVVDRALAACPHAACRAQVYARLAEASDRAGWLRHRELALEQAALGRWRAASKDASLALYQGVDRAMLTAVLELTRAEYREPPDEEVLRKGAVDRLALLLGDEGVCEVLGCTPVALDASLSVDQALDQALAAGLPEAVAAAEAADGALSVLDPHTRVIWPAEIAGWEDHHAGVVVGVGLSLDEGDDGHLRARVPRLGSPAFEAGLHQGDRLVRLASGEITVHLDEVEPELRARAVNLVLGGEPGSMLGVDVQRDAQELHFDLERRAVPVELLTGVERGPDNTWRWWLDPEQRLLYVRILSFKERTDDEFDALVEEVGAPAGVVLDLRGNGGGDLAAALEVADRFVADGILATMQGRGALPPPVDPDVAPWNAALPGHALEGTPVVVLVDGDTASAAELLAGALQERVGALVVGEHTWGKGLSQGLRTHPLGFALEVTNGEVTLPSGRPIDRSGQPWGIEPDHALPYTPMEKRQLVRMQAAAGSLRVHADGSPVAPTAQLQLAAECPKAAECLPSDAQRDLAELLLRAMLVQ